MATLLLCYIKLYAQYIAHTSKVYNYYYYIII